MESGNCDTCHWFEGYREDELELGECHNNSPTTIGGFPQVYPDNWCGDHRNQLKKENLK